MYSVVLDTNVIIAALRSRRGASNRLLRLVGEGAFRITISVALALEYEDVLKRPSLTSYSQSDIDSFLAFLFGYADLVPVVTRRRPILPDPGDEHILELAIESKAFIVTHNARHFLPASQFGINIKTPGEFLEILGAVL